MQNTQELCAPITQRLVWLGKPYVCRHGTNVAHCGTHASLRSIGRQFTEKREFRAALNGHIDAKIIRPRKEEHGGFEEIYLSVRYANAGLDRWLALVWLRGGGGGFILYATLFAVPRLGLVEVGPAPRGGLGVERSAERRRSEEALRQRTALSARVEGVQEALTNVVKHARALSVVIRVDREPGHLRCSIRDDGVGFDADRHPVMKV